MSDTQSTATAGAIPGSKNKVLRWIAIPLRIIAVPLSLLIRPFVFRVSNDGNKVTFTSFSALMYTWVLIPIGLTTHFLNKAEWVSPQALGWAQVLSILMLLVLLGDDMGFWAAVITGMIAVLLGLAARLLSAEYEIGVFNWLADGLRAMQVEYSPGLSVALGFFAFLLISLYVLPKAWFVGRYEITTREITHIRRGVAVESWRRAGRDVKQRWPDILEMVAGLGSGGVYLLDRQQKAVMAIPHVTCLWFYRREVERVLEKIATSNYEEDEEIAEGDD